MTVADDLSHAVEAADLVLVCTPIGAIASTVAAVLEAAPSAIVSDAGSIKGRVADEVAQTVDASSLGRFVPGHPMGGSERSGPEHASASVVDGIVWVIAPTNATDARSVATLEAFIVTIGARPVRLTPERHDRLVAFVSHLPQIASTSLMGLAATEEADEPDILLLAAGGFRDLTRLASSNPRLWSEILLANHDQVARAIDLYVDRLRSLRDQIEAAHRSDVEATFDGAKRARLRLAAKPQVRAGVAVLQVVVPDRPGALALLTATLAEGEVNIEDLQIVHSPEGGRGTVHLTVAAGSAADATRVLAAHDFDPIRLA
jgi:prephenate dehydrogenase